MVINPKWKPASSVIRILVECAHCRNIAYQILQCSYILEIADEDEEQNPKSVYFMFTCETCKQFVLFQADFPGGSIYGNEGLDEEDYFEFWDPEQDEILHRLWHELAEPLPSIVPRTVRECYSEATKIKHAAPNAFAGQIRKALEAVCADKGARQKNEKNGFIGLEKKLKELSERDVLPPLMVEIARELKLLGDIGVHRLDERIDDEQVRIIDEFFRVLVDYVYVAPSKLHEFRARFRRSILDHSETVN